jgi:hypothetical protein
LALTALAGFAGFGLTAGFVLAGADFAFGFAGADFLEGVGLRPVFAITTPVAGLGQRREGTGR